MKRAILALCAALCAAALAAPAPRHPSSLSFPEETFSPPSAREARLSNGIRVFLVEDHELPVITAQVYIRGGSLYDPAGKEGLAELTMSSLRPGGSKTWDPEVLDDEIEHRAARLIFWSGDEMLGGSASALTKEFPWTLAVMADILFHPAFRAKPVAVEKGKMLDWVNRRWDNPSTIAGYKFSEVLYGKHHPEARYETRESLARINVKDMRDFHARFVVPERMMLGVYGDFEMDSMLALLEEIFGAHPAGQAPPLPDIAPVEDRVERKVYYVHRPGLKQTNIRIGHLGLNRHDPDLRRVEVMNHVLSGGMGGRLFSRVRTQRGLAYSVWGSVGSGRDRGRFMVSCSTKPETTAEAIEVILAELENLRQHPPLPEEMARSKRSVTNRFVFQFEGASDVLWKSVENVFYGFPQDRWLSYLDEIRAVTAEEALAMARAHIRPEKAAILVVGDESLFDKPLSTFGEVVPLTLD